MSDRALPKLCAVGPRKAKLMCTGSDGRRRPLIAPCGPPYAHTVQVYPYYETDWKYYHELCGLQETYSRKATGGVAGFSGVYLAWAQRVAGGLYGFWRWVHPQAMDPETLISVYGDGPAGEDTVTLSSGSTASFGRRSPLAAAYTPTVPLSWVHRGGLTLGSATFALDLRPNCLPAPTAPPEEFWAPDVWDGSSCCWDLNGWGGATEFWKSCDPLGWQAPWPFGRVQSDCLLTGEPSYRDPANWVIGAGSGILLVLIPGEVDWSLPLATLMALGGQVYWLQSITTQAASAGGCVYYGDVTWGGSFAGFLPPVSPGSLRFQILGGTSDLRLENSGEVHPVHCWAASGTGTPDIYSSSNLIRVDAIMGSLP